MVPGPIPSLQGLPCSAPFHCGLRREVRPLLLDAQKLIVQSRFFVKRY